MTDKTLETMYKRRMGFKDYAICFLIAVIIFGALGYETRTRELETRLEDHRAFVDGLAGINERLEEKRDAETIAQTIDLLLDDAKRAEYLSGYDTGFGLAMSERCDICKINVTTIGGVE